MAELLDVKAMTGDVTKAAHLERMVANNTASYKYYWLRGVFDEVIEGRERITFTRLVARMAAEAWYPVVFFHLNLGAGDRLHELIDYLQRTYGVPQSPRSGEVVRVVEENVAGDRRLAKLVKDRVSNVPYRLIRPFYERELAAAKRASKKWYDDPMADDAIFYACVTLPNPSAPYVFNEDRNALVVSPEWARFIRDNQAVLNGWLDFKLVQFLQARNPSVPAIAGKLRPPAKRDLAAATKYWKCVLDLSNASDIYSGVPFDADHFAKFGSLTIDHFIPWSFVLHDEVWNLVPMFRNENSSKGDRLPDLERYLDPFCAQQFDALMLVKEAGLAKHHRKQFDSYRAIDANVDAYVRSDASRASFDKSMRNTIIPLYQIALNQGYGLWAS